MTDKTFKGARLKIDRANRHIHELIHIITRFLDTDFCRLVTEPEEGNTGRNRLKVVASADYPPHIPLIVGDAIHNLRSALDHVVVQITGIDADFMGLPTGKKRYDIESKSTSYKTIKQTAPPFAQFILDEIQPYSGGKFKIWELGKLDIIDKHKLIIPTINISSLMNFEVEYERGIRFTNAMAEVGAGGVVNIAIAPGAIKIHNHGKPAVNIRFGPGTPFENQAVLETIANLAELTSQAIQALETFYYGN